MEPDPAPATSSAPNPSHQPFLRAAKSTAFKCEERRKHKEQKRERKRQDRLALALEQWEPLGAPPCRAAISPSGGAAVRASRAFFGEHADNDDDDDGGDEDGEEEGSTDVTQFFKDLLEKDAGLRAFYEAERETGWFLCLVCEGIGVRAGKRFPGCAALVQHTGTVARTKRRLAHRAFGDTVGHLIGWGAGRTTPFPMQADSVNNGASDEAGHLDASESAEMEMT
ncbi:hypothetical protein ACQ4PT_045420 [Festuca glaucescens]